MARKAKFKAGEQVTYTGQTIKRSLFIDNKGQYVYRNKPVVNLRDASGDLIAKAISVAQVNRVHEAEIETVAIDLPPQHLLGKTIKINNPVPLCLQEQAVEQVATNKYQRTICEAGTTNSLTVDVYDVLEAFKVTCPALQHLAKKALCVGIRGHKDTEQDLKDIIASAERALQLHYNRMGI